MGYQRPVLSNRTKLYLPLELLNRRNFKELARGVARRLHDANVHPILKYAAAAAWDQDTKVTIRKVGRVGECSY